MKIRKYLKANGVLKIILKITDLSTISDSQVLLKKGLKTKVRFFLQQIFSINNNMHIFHLSFQEKKKDILKVTGNITSASHNKGSLMVSITVTADITSETFIKLPHQSVTYGAF